MIYTKELLERVKSYGILGYSIDKIFQYVNPEDPELFRAEISDTETMIGYVYNEGLNQGQYKLDAAIFKLQSAEAEKATMEVKRAREVDAMIGDYLGENIEL